jgi:hypothetical protein
MANRWAGFVRLLLVAGVVGWTGAVMAEDVVTIGDLIKSPGSYQTKTIIVRGTVSNAPSYRMEDSTCGAMAYLHRFRLVDESGAIGITAVGCLHGTFMGQGGRLDQLTDGMKLEVMGRVQSDSSGVSIESVRMSY